jgi:ABC-2 type transport system permease protein
MRAWIVARKALREVRREPVMVALTLVFGPALVLLYLMVFPETAPSYGVVVVNADQGVPADDGAPVTAGDDVAAALRALVDADGKAVLVVRTAESVDAARDVVEDREAEAILVLPADFSARVRALADAADAGPVRYTLSGDLTSAKYLVTAVLTDSAMQASVAELTGRSAPVQVTEEPLGGSGTRSEFELYVPGLIVFSVILLVFLAAMLVAREFESGGMRRLRLTRMTGADYVVGTSAVLTLLGGSAVALTFLTAWLCGFRSQGPMWVGGLLLGLAALSVIGVGLMTAALARTVVKAFVLANFPLAVLMFFSGAMFPMPRITWFKFAGHPVGPFELLAPTHAVTGLTRVVTMGDGFGDVLFEVAALVLLTAGCLLGGVWMVRRAAAQRVR